MRSRTRSASSSWSRQAAATVASRSGSSSSTQNSRADLGIADRQRGREGEDPVADVLLAAAAERGEPALVADVVAAVVQHPEQVAVLPEPL